MWYLVSETYVYTSMTCSDQQSWQTWDATLMTTLSVTLDSQPSTSSESRTLEATSSASSSSSILNISAGQPSGNSNSSGDANPQDSNHSLGVIMGGVFGGIGAVSILAGLAWFFHRRIESKKRAGRALAYDPADSSSDDPEPPNIIGSPHTASVHCSVKSSKLTGGLSQGHPQMGYTDSPLGSPNIDGDSIHIGGLLTPTAMTPGAAPSVHSTHADQPVYEMHADNPAYEVHGDSIGPAELPA